MVPRPAPDDAGSEKQAKAIVAWSSLNLKEPWFFLNNFKMFDLAVVFRCYRVEG